MTVGGRFKVYGIHNVRAYRDYRHTKIFRTREYFRRDPMSFDEIIGIMRNWHPKREVLA